MPDLDAIFAALSDPTRRAIVARLAQGPAGVQDLAAPTGLSQPTVSRHLAVLERAGLVTVEVDGNRRPRRLAAAPLVEATGWIDRTRALWEANHARLDAVLDELQTPAPRKGPDDDDHDR